MRFKTRNRLRPQSHVPFGRVLIIITIISAGTASAGYTAMDLYTLRAPAGLTVDEPSRGNPTASGGQVVGIARASDGTPHPILWTASGLPIDLAPAGTPFAWIDAFATNGTQQVGQGQKNGGGHAVVWNGTADSMVDLNPANASESRCFGTNGVQQAGMAYIGGVAHAFFWNGTPESAVDLGLGQARGTDGITQVGQDSDHAPTSACLWHGTAGSRSLLPTPSISDSVALAVKGDEVVGDGVVAASGRHALLWGGTTAPPVDLHPSQFGFSDSEAIATNGSVEAGWMSGPSALAHAVVWNGTAASAVDLHTLLPDGYTMSEAYGVDASGDVFGIARDLAGNWHSVEWAVPEPMSVWAVSILLLVCRRVRLQDCKSR
jgi:hypothetical protein